MQKITSENRSYLYLTISLLWDRHTSQYKFRNVELTVYNHTFVCSSTAVLELSSGTYLEGDARDLLLLFLCIIPIINRSLYFQPKWNSGLIFTFLEGIEVSKYGMDSHVFSTFHLQYKNLI